MNRTPLDYLRDALESMHRAQDFVAGMEFDAFAHDDKTIYAVVRALESSAKP